MSALLQAPQFESGRLTLFPPKLKGSCSDFILGISWTFSQMPLKPGQRIRLRRCSKLSRNYTVRCVIRFVGGIINCPHRWRSKNSINHHVPSSKHTHAALAYSCARRHTRRFNGCVSLFSHNTSRLPCRQTSRHLSHAVVLRRRRPLRSHLRLQRPGAQVRDGDARPPAEARAVRLLRHGSGHRCVVVLQPPHALLQLGSPQISRLASAPRRMRLIILTSTRHQFPPSFSLLVYVLSCVSRPLLDCRAPTCRHRLLRFEYIRAPNWRPRAGAPPPASLSLQQASAQQRAVDRRACE